MEVPSEGYVSDWLGKQIAPKWIFSKLIFSSNTTNAISSVWRLELYFSWIIIDEAVRRITESWIKD